MSSTSVLVGSTYQSVLRKSVNKYNILSPFDHTTDLHLSAGTLLLSTTSVANTNKQSVNGLLQFRLQLISKWHEQGTQRELTAVMLPLKGQRRSSLRTAKG